MPRVTAGDRSNDRPYCLGKIVPGADEDEIPEKREPGRHEGDAPTRVSCFEQPFAVFTDGTPIGTHARAFRNARLERA